MTEAAFTVDLVIAVHNPQRPIARAVRSGLDSGADVRTTVVCHNVGRGAIAAALGEIADHSRVRLIELHDGVRSPSGPFNAGIDIADAAWVAIMGSDDELEAGAIDDWLATAVSNDADMVLPPIVRRGDDGDQLVATPPASPRCDRGLQGVRDRLAYRSAPLGLIRRAALGDLRFDGGIATGEDVLFSARLYFSGIRIVRHRGRGYVVHDDATDRVTSAPVTVREALGFVDGLLDSRWFRSQPLAVRIALAVKTLRVNVLGQFVARPAPAQWTEAERDDLLVVVRALEQSAPGAIDRLSRADRALLDALDPTNGEDAHRIVALAARRRRYGLPSTVATRRIEYVLDREGPGRVMLNSWLTLRADARARRGLVN